MLTRCLLYSSPATRHSGVQECCPEANPGQSKYVILTYMHVHGLGLKGHLEAGPEASLNGLPCLKTQDLHSWNLLETTRRARAHHTILY